MQHLQPPCSIPSHPEVADHTLSDTLQTLPDIDPKNDPVGTNEPCKHVQEELSKYRYSTLMELLNCHLLRQIRTV